MNKLLCFSLFLLIPVRCVAQDIQVRHVVVPDYPSLPRMASIEGSVDVEVEIDSEGKVINTKASGGHPLLQRAAQANVRLWRFSPLKPPGDPNQNRMTVTYVYKIEGQAAYGTAPEVTLDLPSRVEIITRPAEVER